MAPQERTATDAVVEARERYVAAGVATPPLVVAAEARIEDVDGSHVHRLRRRPRLPEHRPRAAGGGRGVHEQVDRYLHQCFMVGMYEPYVEVCRRLAELAVPAASRRACS